MSKFLSGWVCILSLFFVLGCAGTLTAAPQWENTGEFAEPMPTFPLNVETSDEDLIVYAEPYENSAVVGKLKNPLPSDPDPVEGDVLIVEVRLLKDDEGIHDAWWRISFPVEGWVRGPDLALWYSDFLYEFFF